MTSSHGPDRMSCPIYESVGNKGLESEQKETGEKALIKAKDKRSRTVEIRSKENTKSFLIIWYLLHSLPPKRINRSRMVNSPPASVVSSFNFVWVSIPSPCSPSSSPFVLFALVGTLEHGTWDGTDCSTFCLSILSVQFLISSFPSPLSLSLLCVLI